ncbi:MAG: substrate-binding domain-containing protein [Chloroflexi bacterium]|nr:substrate-binding domain-containing protein [Chloroflexota bacterium]
MATALALPVAAQDSATYHIGASNTLQGNGWREEMICSIKAQALSSGQVSQLTVAHRNTDAAGQISDLNDLINAGVQAIIVNPVSPDALNDVIKQATDAGIVVVAVDLAVTEPSAYLFSNNQEEYGYVGAKWLFEKLGGEGAVFYMRGAAGTSADTDRDTGFRRAMAEYPGITLAGEVFTGWDIAQGAQQINEFLASGVPFDGIWTSGIDSTIVDALVTAGAPLVPVVGADNAGFVEQLATIEGLEGAAVTNPGSVGGAGVTMALRVLAGEEVERQVLITPEVWDNTTPEGQAAIAAANDPAIDGTWPLGISIPDWTTYTKDEIIACAGPGE